jgi:ribosome biogenesis GTPase
MLVTDAETGQTTGTVLTGRNNIFTVDTEFGSLLCRLKGKRLDIEERSYSPLSPGDLVTLSELDTGNSTAIIDDRLTRRNAFERYNVKRNLPQTLAANVDQALCVSSLHHPRFRPRFVDRFLALCEFQGVAGGVVLNKSDLDTGQAPDIVSLYGGIGYPVSVVSATEGSGLEALKVAIEGVRTVLVGQSGVGKSALLNAIVGTEVQRTGEISARYLRGRHTTNAGRLLKTASAEIIDTPGIRDLDVRLISTGELAWCYREFRPFMGTCKHGDCSHVEEPGCGIERACKDGEIPPARYESYCRLHAELQHVETEQS